MLRHPQIRTAYHLSLFAQSWRLINDTIFNNIKKVTEHKTCFDFLYHL